MIQILSGRAGRGHVSENPAGNSDDAVGRTADQGPARALTPAAERALAEAAARRAETDRKEAERPKELRGRAGPRPTRRASRAVTGIGKARASGAISKVGWAAGHIVMAGHSRSKNGVASLAYVPDQGRGTLSIGM